MTLSQVIGIMKKFGLQIVRSKWTIPYLLIFPAFFIGAYWFGFGASDIGVNKTYNLGIVNNDAGFGDEVEEFLETGTVQDWFPHSPEVMEKGFAIELIEILNSTKYSNETGAERIFDVNVLTTYQEGMEKLERRELDILVEFSPSFSNASLASLNNYWKINYGQYMHEMIQYYYPEAPDFPVLDNETIVITGDETYMNYKIARSMVILFLEKYQDIGSFFDSPGGTVSLVLNEDYLVSLPKYSVFEIILPGLIAFGIIVQPSLFAGLLCLEFHSDQRTFDRLMLASLPATQYVLGTLLIQVPVIIVQTIVLFVFSLLLGFNPLGNVFLGFFIALTVLPFAASLSYITAAFVSNEDVAGTILGFGSPIIGYASGAFTTLPHLVLIPDFFPAASGATRDFLIWDLLPLTHAVNALKNVLLYDFSLGQVFIDLSTNIILSLLMLVIAAVIFAKLRFRSP